MSRNSEPYSSGLPFRDSIYAPKFPLNATNIWLFVCAASCVHFEEKTCFASLLAGFMISFLLVGTSHVALYFCFIYNLLLMFFAICLPLSRAWRRLSVIFLFSASIGFVSSSFRSVSVRKLNVFFWKVLLGEWQLCFWPNGLVPKIALCQFPCLRGCVCGGEVVPILSLGCI